MPSIVLVVDTNTQLPAAELERRFLTGTNRHTLLVRFIRFLEGMAGGFRSTAVEGVKLMTSGVTASGTIGCDVSDAVDGTDEIVIGPTTLAVEAAPANENQFDGGASDIAFAANLVAAINAHSVLKNLVVATTDGIDTVTVTSRFPGIIGNEIGMSEVGNGFTISGAALTGGTNGTMVEYDL